MKKILFLSILIIITLNAQTYTEQWKEIKKLEQNRLPKSALEKVEAIYKKAKEENNSPQLIKAIIHKNRYLSTLNHKESKVSIKNIERELQKNIQPATKLILKSMLAEIYSRETYVYYGEDVDETIEDNSNKASQLYLESLGEEAKYVKIEKYKEILTEERNSTGLRPTLYDFLAFRALKYFSNNRNYLKKPIYNFYIKDREAFGDITTFINYQFQTPNKKSYKYKSLRIYQKLLQFHQSRGDTKALQHVNFERIHFVYRNFVGEEKERYYIDALNSLESQNPNSEALYYLAQHYFERNDYRKAIKYAKKGIKNPDKFISQKCLFIKKNIELQSININMEKVNLPNENLLAKITYRNINKIFVKVIKITEKEQDELDKRREQDELNRYILGLNSINEFNLTLPIADDYKSHNTEISLGSYELGHYIFLVSKEKEFKNFSKNFSAISKLAYLHKNSKLMVVDRESGKPLEGVEAKLYLSKYNRRTNRSKKEFISTKTSDKDGIITLPQIEHEYGIHLKYGEDSLNFARGTSYTQEYDRENRARKMLYFFTDRAIYRPSQTIYFKALAIKKGKKSEILTNENIEVTLYSSNGQKIETKKFKTNEFGTINGFFLLPKKGRLGRVRLSSNIFGNKIVRVEEYKRAKFDVSFLKLDKSYRLGDSITVQGVAKAFAGNPLDGVSVKYSIKRAVSFPWSHNYRVYYNQASQIDMGEIKTDKNGKFTIHFNAIVDKSIPTDKKPSFNYTVSVDITDSTGETHSAIKSINLGVVALNVSMKIEKEINIDLDNSIKITSTNLDNKFEPIQGRVVIEKFKNEKNIYRDRYWSTNDIDKFIYTKEKFKKLFKNYKPIEKIQREKEFIKTLNFDTKKSKSINLGKLKEGEYLITLHTVDRYGTEVQKSKRVIAYNPNSSNPPYLTQLWDKSDKKEYKVGSTAKINIRSSSTNSFVYLMIEKNQKIVTHKWIELSKVNRELVKIDSSDRGGIFYYLSMIKNNREYNSFRKIKVPWRKKLKVEYRSFRDKLKPNQQEQWSIKISGEDKDKVVAEMVATMYDASLDKITKHDFNIRNLFPDNRSRYENRWEPRTFSISRGYTQWSEYGIERELRRVFSRIRRFNNYQRGHYSDPYTPVALAMARVQPAPITQANIVVEGADVVYQSAEYSSFTEETEDGLGGDIGGVPIFKDSAKPAIRKNLKETMFFKPNLKTDKDGNIVINFKTNEALTRWRFLAFAHTKELQSVVTEKEIVTQKELMVVTNLPRFFREGDIITLSAKVVNMSQKDLTGVCQLKLQNPENGWNIYGDHNFSKKISLKKGTSTKVDFKIRVPQVDSVSTIQHTIIAKTQNYSDAEQVIKPILSNREFITESKALYIKGKETKSFTLESLKNNNSQSLKNHKLILEFTSNPIWYAIKSLPYLMEYPHACSEQIFNRYFANAIASKIINSTPKIKKVFDSWRDKKELKSALRENQELKAILLEETPWVLNAKSEEEQQKNLAMLFDITKLAQERDSILSKLSQRQKRDGGWAWFDGARANWYITQYIVEGFGRLQELGVKQNSQKMIKKAIKYMDRRVMERYRWLNKSIEKGNSKFEKDNIDSILIHYLYSRSFYKLPIEDNLKQAYNYYLKQIEKYWMNKGLYQQGMIALTLYKKGKIESAKAIVKSLKERALIDDEMGMYFKYQQGFYWYQMPIETHALMIDVFNTITKDKKSVELLKIWLLKNKQTTHWKTTTATASAIHALLLDDTSLSNSKLVEISFDTETKYQPILQNAKILAQKGSGYFKASFNNFDKKMSTVKIKNPNSNIAWGGLYWQYFEDLDKIKSFKETPLKIDKRLYLVRGDSSIPIDSQSILKIGDKIKVKIKISINRDMEYIMIKDSRASAFEPINTLSQYRWQRGLGYYESTRDNATYFFIDYLRRGTYNFEYSLFVTHRGSFSNGIATAESMYAPEFKTHTKGEQINVK